MTSNGCPGEYLDRCPLGNTACVLLVDFFCDTQPLRKIEVLQILIKYVHSTPHFTNEGFDFLNSPLVIAHVTCVNQMFISY